MSDDRWRTRLRWVVVHPHDPAVLLARRDGVLALPETERPGQVWTADPAEVLPALGELLGADALLLDCLDDHQDPAAGVQRATLLAVPREAPARPRGWPGWVGPAWPAPVPARPPWPPRVVEELERGPGGDGGQPWAARGWFAEAERWLRSTMERLGRPLTGPVRQARVWRAARAWELAAPLGALHQAVSYRSLATRPPGDPHMAQSTAWWLRQVLAGLA
ncbi:MAG TPA: hypothetical protein VI751_04255 [Actinomycetota bacterium]|jgi:hypothetical protein